MTAKPHIVILDAKSLGDDLVWPDFEMLGATEMYDATAPAELKDRVKNANIILTNKVVIKKELIDTLPNLQYIGTIATGFNQVDINAAKKRHIPVCNVPDYSTPSVMQHTFALILSLCNKIDMHAKAVAEGEWCKSEHFCFWKEPTVELLGKTLGVVGFGNTGKAVAQMGHCFGMSILAFAPRPKPLPPYGPFAFASIEEVFSQSDIVSLHCPLTPENRGMVNADLLRTMKKTAFFINCARGPLVNEEDLAAALQRGVIAGAGLDVVKKEPMVPENPLLHAPNCIITPHIAWSSVEARSRLLEGVFTNVKNFLGGTPSNVVNSVSVS